MRYGAERGNGAAAGLHADPPVLRQIIIDKYPAAGQNVRLLLQTTRRDASVSTLVTNARELCTCVTRPRATTDQLTLARFNGQSYKSGTGALAFQNQNVCHLIRKIKE